MSSVIRRLLAFDGWRRAASPDRQVRAHLVPHRVRATLAKFHEKNAGCRSFEETSSPRSSGSPRRRASVWLPSKCSRLRLDPAGSRTHRIVAIPPSDRGRDKAMRSALRSPGSVRQGSWRDEVGTLGVDAGPMEGQEAGLAPSTAGHSGLREYGIGRSRRFRLPKRGTRSNSWHGPAVAHPRISDLALIVSIAS
jgi:hypothetical protein